MKYRRWAIIITVIVLFTLACGLTEIGFGDGEGPEAIATQVAGAVEGVPEMTSGEIPEGYPENEIPIYEPASSVILGGFRQQMDDVLVYNLVIGSDDDMETVTQNIINKFEGESTEFENMGGMLMGIKDGWEYSIIINSGEVDGYATLVTYMLTKQ